MLNTELKNGVQEVTDHTGAFVATIRYDGDKGVYKVEDMYDAGQAMARDTEWHTLEAAQYFVLALHLNGIATGH